jgi:hypothetical protein
MITPVNQYDFPSFKDSPFLEECVGKAANYHVDRTRCSVLRLRQHYAVITAEAVSIGAMTSRGGCHWHVVILIMATTTVTFVAHNDQFHNNELRKPFI